MPDPIVTPAIGAVAGTLATDKVKEKAAEQGFQWPEPGPDEWARRIATLVEEQRDRTVRPLDLSNAGTGNGVAYTSHTRLRVRTLIYSSATGGIVRLKVGNYALMSMIAAAATVVVLPLPIIIDRGQTVQVLYSNADEMFAYLFAWEE